MNYVCGAREKGKRGTEVPRPFGSAHKGASAFTGVCRTVDAVAPVSGQDDVAAPAVRGL